MRICLSCLYHHGECPETKICPAIYKEQCIDVYQCGRYERKILEPLGQCGFEALVYRTETHSSYRLEPLGLEDKSHTHAPCWARMLVWNCWGSGESSHESNVTRWIIWLGSPARLEDNSFLHVRLLARVLSLVNVGFFRGCVSGHPAVCVGG